MNENRERLLQGLYAVRKELQQVLSYERKLESLSGQMRGEKRLIRSTTGGAKLWQLIVSLFMAMLALDTVSSLLSGDVSTAVLCGAVLLLIYKFYKPEWFQDKEKSGKKIPKWVIVLVCVVCFPFTIMAAASAVMAVVTVVGSLFVNPIRGILSIAGAGALYVLLSKKREQANADIVSYNQETRALNQQLQQQYAAASQQLNWHIQEVQRIGQGWFPRNYYCLYAVNCFIQYLENYQADTVKEMVNLFEDSEHKRRLEENQRQIMENQYETQRQLDFMNLSNIIENQVARDNADRNTDRIVDAIYNRR